MKASGHPRAGCEVQHDSSNLARLSRSRVDVRLFRAADTHPTATRTDALVNPPASNLAIPLESTSI